MSDFWDKQIERADLLAGESGGSKEMLRFYAQLLRAQKEIYLAFRGRTHWLPSGDLENDVAVVQASMSWAVATCCAELVRSRLRRKRKHS